MTGQLSGFGIVITVSYLSSNTALERLFNGQLAGYLREDCGLSWSKARDTPQIRPPAHLHIRNSLSPTRAPTWMGVQTYRQQSKCYQFDKGNLISWLAINASLCPHSYALSCAFHLAEHILVKALDLSSVYLYFYPVAATRQTSQHANHHISPGRGNRCSGLVTHSFNRSSTQELSSRPSYSADSREHPSSGSSLLLPKP